jgi:molybdate transport system ATP-binding protein
MSGTGIDAALAISHPGFALNFRAQWPAAGFTALFGPSGVGKTSVLRAIAGLDRATGRLTIQDEIWQDDDRGLFVPPHRRALGFVFQDSALFTHLDVRRNLEFGQRRVPERERRVRFEQVVEWLALAPLLSRGVDALSGGERQRVAIARALAASPRLLLLDEPLASLDLSRRAELLPFLQRLQAELDIPAIYVSHAPDEVAQLAQHLVLLGDGAVRASGPAVELMTRLDLPLAHGDSAQSLFEVTLRSHDAGDGLARAEFAGGGLWLPMAAAVIGQRRRVRVFARDVSLTLSRHTDSSILNILPVKVLAIEADSPGQVMLRLDTGGPVLLARLTLRSASALGLRPGSEAFAQIKGVALGA